MAAQQAAPVLIDHDVAGCLEQQGAWLGDRHAGALDRQDARIAFLHDVGRRIAVFDRAGTEVQQFPVVAFEHVSAQPQKR